MSSTCKHYTAQGAHPEYAPHLTGAQLECSDCGEVFPNSRAWTAAVNGVPYDDRPLECIDSWEDDPCEGTVEYRIPLSATGESYPRCDQHWAERYDYEMALRQRYPVNAPSDFDPLYAGESWDEDY